MPIVAITTDVASGQSEVEVLVRISTKARVFANAHRETAVLIGAGPFFKVIAVYPGARIEGEGGFVQDGFFDTDVVDPEGETDRICFELDRVRCRSLDLRLCT